LILAAMAFGPTALVAVVAATAARQKGIGAGGLAVVVVVLAAGLAVSAYFVAAELRMQVRVDARGIVRIDPLRRVGIAWDEVERLAYNGVSRWFFVSGARGKRLWVPENMAGIGDFAVEVLSRVPPSAIAADGATREALEQLVSETREEDAAAGKAMA
ncbi:MAG TPA: PH domain-containing protein, partial [Anaeromyxobacteraceae bacterium]|nr:PH domain-containing protein [Anaeromyxobacteraceae bacterium]